MGIQQKSTDRGFSKLANPYHIINMDSTPNKIGQITEYVQAYVEIGLQDNLISLCHQPRK